MKLYLVRHAQSLRNARQKSTHDSDLSEIGQEQARRLGSYFKNKHIDLIYCSTMIRAMNTLKEILPYLKKSKVVYSKEIVEHKMGTHGKDSDDWTTFAKAASESGKPFHLYKPKGGESLTEVYKRAGKFYKNLLKKHRKDNVLVVGHGIFSLYLILNALKLDVLEGKYYSLSNASVSQLDINPTEKVTYFNINDYNHLIFGGMKK